MDLWKMAQKKRMQEEQQLRECGKNLALENMNFLRDKLIEHLMSTSVIYTFARIEDGGIVSLWLANNDQLYAPVQLQTLKIEREQANYVMEAFNKVLYRKMKVEFPINPKSYYSYYDKTTYTVG